MKNSIDIEIKITDLLTIILSNSAGAYVSMFAAYVQLWHRKKCGCHVGRFNSYILNIS